MSDPGYDFFAVGAPRPPQAGPDVEPAVLPPPGASYPPPAPVYAPPAALTPVNQFGTPQGAVNQFGTPQGAVNQFGTPVDAAAVPTGPYAAPGYGAAPVATPGLVSTWDGPGEPRGRAAARVAAPAWARPQQVTAGAIIGLVLGVIVLGTFLMALFGTLALSSQVPGLDAETGVKGASALGAGITGVLFGVTAILGITAALYLAASVAVLRDRRWGGWALVILSGVYILWTLPAIPGGGLGLASWLELIVDVVLVLLFVTGEGLHWLQRR